jgi:hypothetical protein
MDKHERRRSLGRKSLETLNQPFPCQDARIHRAASLLQRILPNDNSEDTQLELRKQSNAPSIDAAPRILTQRMTTKVRATIA